jgi:uncharacterized protein YecA (UPF0149 family)
VDDVAAIDREFDVARERDDHPSAEALIADLLLRAGRTQEADEPCWCGSKRKYKKCCLRAG